MANRSQLRIAAMQMVYEHFSGGNGGEDTLQMIYDELQAENTSGSAIVFHNSDNAYVMKLLKGVCDHQAELDEKITLASKYWAIDRIAKVDLDILRMAIWEILYEDDVPDGVIINEAVNLAKQYSDENSGKFINGVLGTIVRNKSSEADTSNNHEETESKVAVTSENETSENEKEGN